MCILCLLKSVVVCLLLSRMAALRLVQLGASLQISNLCMYFFTKANLLPCLLLSGVSMSLSSYSPHMAHPDHGY
jgi:hypothetical protein